MYTNDGRASACNDVDPSVGVQRAFVAADAIGRASTRAARERAEHSHIEFEMSMSDMAYMATANTTGMSAAELEAALGEHVLGWSSEAGRTAAVGWLAKIPSADPGDGRRGMAYQDAAQITLHFVALDQDADDVGFSEAYISSGVVLCAGAPPEIAGDRDLDLDLGDRNLRRRAAAAAAIWQPAAPGVFLVPTACRMPAICE